MSCIYFHSPHGYAKLAGSERAWLDYISKGPARTAYNLDGLFSLQLEKVGRLLELVPPNDELHTLYKITKEENASYKSSWVGKTLSNPGRMPDHEPWERLKISLQHRIVDAMFDSAELRLDDMTLDASSVSRNTALIAGSDVVKLAAKIHCYCEIHAFIEGHNRNWVADIIDDGLDTGLYHKQMDYQTHYGETKRIDQGWEKVQELLRLRDDEPVVMSYSVTDSFPNADAAEWQDNQDGDKFYELPEQEQWDRAFAGISKKSWLSITPETLGGVFFGSPITVYDLLAYDRDDRIRAKYDPESENM